MKALAWDQKGHDIVASIASAHLSEHTASCVAEILEGRSLEYWSYWLENASYSPEYSFMLPWHYIYLPAGQAYNPDSHSSRGDIVTAIIDAKAALSDVKSTSDRRFLALKQIVHLVADIHQPLHAGHREDNGGSTVYLKYFGTSTSLRYVWDTSMVETAHDWTYTEWREQIDRAKPSQVAEITSSDVHQWTRECIALAEKIYEYFPTDKDIDINDVVAWTPVIETQMLKAGLRLAALLNDIFDAESAGVENVSIDTPATDAIFTLSGIYVGSGDEALSRLPMGIYVRSGRKILVK